jgi:ABC-type transport system substrate-binding protein
VNRWRLLGCALALLVLAAPASATTAQRKVAVFGVNGDVTGFNIELQCCNSGPGGFAATAALRGAFQQDAKGRFVGDLVTKATATRRSITYTINPNAVWYWGGRKVPVTYKDFVYTVQQVDDPRNDIQTREPYANLDPTHFTHNGLRQVTFFWRTKGCTSDFPCGSVPTWQRDLFAAAPGVFPSFALKGQDFNKIWMNCICGSDGKPVANGPFYLAKYVPGQQMTLRRNPFWYGKKARLKEVVFKLFSDPDLEIEAMRQGAIDAMTGPFSPDVLSLQGTPGVTISLNLASYDLELLQFREGDTSGGPTVTKGASNPLLEAPWMREAIGLGINRRAIINGEYGTFAARIKTDNSLIFFPQDAGYRADFRRWNYNPRKALALLRSHCVAGSGPAAPRVGNEKIWRCSGFPATFRWTWTATNVRRTTAEQIAATDLKAIGIEIVPRPLPGAVIFGPDGIPSGDFDLANFAFTSVPSADWYEVYRCHGDVNSTGFCSDAVNRVLTAAHTELNPSKRTTDLQQLDRLLARSVPIFPLFGGPGVTVHKSKLLGVNGPVEDWYWRP